VAEHVHIPVLLSETVEQIALWSDGVYVDCTFGRGGHSRALLSMLGPDARLFAIDRDPQACAAMADVADARFEGIYGAFADVQALLAGRLDRGVDGIMMDIGVSSPQIDQPERGFSFRHDGPLDMRMDPQSGESAADFIARASARELAEVIKNYGEERFAFQIATAIVASRENRAINTTRQLAEIVAATVRSREPGQDPATRTFQALRIHVNQELAQLEQGLSGAFNLLRSGGRLAVISFHSLEDRIVKQFIDRRASPAAYENPRLRRLPVPAQAATLRKIARVRASDAQIAANPRSRSATLRVAEKV
jgi:16S rRNA (cytosine1402-N4)-methyltransferase